MSRVTTARTAGVAGQMSVLLSGPWRPGWDHATCRTPGCSRRGLEQLPSLGSCPGCSEPLAACRPDTSRTPRTTTPPISQSPQAAPGSAPVPLAARQAVGGSRWGQPLLAGLGVLNLFMVAAPGPVAVGVGAASVLTIAGYAFAPRRSRTPAGEVDGHHDDDAHDSSTSPSTSAVEPVRAPGRGTGSYFGDVDTEFETLLADLGAGRRARRSALALPEVEQPPAVVTLTARPHKVRCESCGRTPAELVQLASNRTPAFNTCRACTPPYVVVGSTSAAGARSRDVVGEAA